MARKVSASLTILMLLALPSASGESSAQETSPPNVLVIVTDDQRAMGTLGPSVMPFVRKTLIEEGARFTAAHATTPLCCPARATLFTGQFAHNHGIKQDGQSKRLDQESTIQFYLQRAGYRTAIFGKYLNGWDVTLPPPYFHRWATFSQGLQFGSNGYRNVTFNVQGTVKEVPDYSTTFIRKKAVDFIRDSEGHDARPWFLYLAPFAPHSPAIPQKKYRTRRVSALNPTPAMLESDRSDKPPYVQDRSVSLDWVDRFRRRQLRTLMSVDDLVQKVFEALWEKREDRDTLVFFLSDNGHLWGEHGLATKRVPYTASIQVPLFVRWPGHVEPGAVDTRLAANIDVAPTILEAAGVEADAPMDGRSLLTPWTRTRMLTEFWAPPEGPIPTWASIRDGTYQYVEYYKADGSIAFREYYDLVADPWQLTNTLGDGNPSNDPPPNVLDALSAQLAADRACAGATCP